MSTPRRVIGYIRVSTNKQDIGPEVQVRELTREAEARGWELDLRREDAASAKSLKGRPVLAQALADLKAGRADVLAVSKLDRLSRSVADFARILDDAERQYWDVICLDLGVDTTTITGRAMAQVTATFAEMERRRIGERTRAAMAQLPPEVRDRMRRGGRPVAVSPDAVSRARELRASGLTLQAVCDQLTAEGVPTATGGQWWPATVSKMLDRAEREAAKAVAA
ncbi:recombinase family protein [Micrococcus luteus]|uniref:recombinase family protein n=1 Tax=Micrococcus luteus TaxID=1270 RepID=UPI00147D2977|nr:recombinase family protein [Micrococcus luteus]NNM48546.1 recombinase family protein [Micrococcus luteus]